MIYHITYLSDGYRVNGLLGLPNEFNYPTDELKSNFIACHNRSVSLNSSKKVMPHSLPALIYCRGGIGKFGEVKSSWVESFAKAGFVTFAPTYRGNEGSEGRDQFGGEDRNDVNQAFKILTNLSFVDKKTISIMGFSRGSINATLSAIEMPTHRLILWSGVSDLEATYRERIDLRRMLKRVIGGTPQKNPNDYQDRSPIHLVESIRCPVLIIHGTADTQVLYSHGLNMYKRLKNVGNDVEFHTYNNLEHHFPLPIHELAVKKMTEWIKTDKNFSQ